MRFRRLYNVMKLASYQPKQTEVGLFGNYHYHRSPACVSLQRGLASKGKGGILIIFLIIRTNDTHTKKKKKKDIPV